MRKKSSTLRRLVLLTSLCVWVSPILAHAQSTAGLSPEVIAAAERGRELFDEGRYQEAIDLLNEAYETHHEPIFFQYIGRCYQELEEYCRAAQNYRRFLREGDPPEAVRSQVTERLIELDDACAAGPSSRGEDEHPRRGLDGEDLGPPRRFGGGAGSGGEDAGRGLRLAGVVMMGLGAAGLVPGVVLWGLALNEDGKHDELDESSNTYDEDVALETYNEFVRPFALSGDVAGILGAAVLVTGLVLYFVGRSRSRASASRRSSLALGETSFLSPLAF